MDTIYALATARGKAGVAVVRVSGPEAFTGLTGLVGSFGPPRVAVLRRLRQHDDVIDQALVLRFEAGHSFTGEDVVELHLHGGLAIVRSVLDGLGAIDGFRMADPGEFTRRALSNGRLDLSQVEGLADLIASETDAQRRQAMRMFSGALGSKAEGWRSRLLRGAALIEAVLDFVDEAVPVDVMPEVRALVGSVLAELLSESEGYDAAERIRDGFEVAIIGPPNVGKSTLLNRLAGREVALTSVHAGTTRDIIEVRMELNGLPVTLLDTAGLRSTADPVEQMGVARAVERARIADLRIFLLEGDHDTLSLPQQPGDLLVRGKADLLPGPGLSVSGLTGLGIDELIISIGSVLSEKAASAGTITHARHKAIVVRSIGALELVMAMIDTGADGEELVAESLRDATRALDELVGRIDVDDLLGEIFSSFCIGK